MACYRIQIGEARIAYEPREQTLGFDIATLFYSDHAEPPALPYGVCNWRDYTGYGRFHEFCIRNDLETLFYGTGWQIPGCRYGPCPRSFHRDEPLMNGGWAVLCEGDLRLVRAARKMRREQVQDAPSAWWDGDDDGDCPEGYDEDLSFLEWMEWWMEWSLKTCERPIIVIA